MARLFLQFFLIVGLLLPALAQAAAPTALPPEQLAVQLQAAYDQLTMIRADFTQVSNLAMQRRQQRAQGTVIMVKPGRMRWDYQSPDRQILISDGETITMYFAKNKQMIITSAKEYLQSDMTYAFFVGQGNLIRDFTISTVSRPSEPMEGYTLELVPKKPQPQISRIVLRLNRVSFLIETMNLTDHFGTETRLTFSNLQVGTDGPEISPDLFTIHPPPDTEIIRQ